MDGTFISEKIKPVTETMDTARMAAGEPGLAREFLWRRRTLKVARVLSQWKEKKDCSHGSTDRYNHKFWYELELEGGAVAKVYFLRPSPKNLKDAGWWLYTLDQP